MQDTTIEQIKEVIPSLYSFVKQRTGFGKDISQIIFKLKPDQDNGIFGKTAHYDPGDMSITLFTAERHPKDILRSFSHELLHHDQGCRGELTDEVMADSEPGYAQRNKHLRKLEGDAYLRGNLIFRDWEDHIKYGDSKETVKIYESFGHSKLELLTEKYGEVSSNEEKTESQYFMEGIDFLEKMHDSLNLTPDEKIEFHETFIETIGEKIEDLGFSLGSFEVGYALDYEFEDIEFTIYPFGKYGLENENFEDEIDNDKKILLRVEMNDKEEKQQNIVQKKYDSFQRLYQDISRLATNLQGE